MVGSHGDVRAVTQNVRVAVIGPFGPPQMAAIRVFAEHGIETVFFHLGAGRRLRRTPPILAGYEMLPGDVTSRSGGMARMADLVAQHGCTHTIAIAYRLSRWLDEALAPLGDAVTVCSPAPGTFAFLDGKAEQIALAGHLGFELLPTHMLTSVADAEPIPDADYPLVLRPDGPTSPHFKIEKIDDPAALTAFLATFVRGYRIVAQPYTPGPNILMQGARAVDGRLMDHAAFIADYKYQGVTQRLRPIETPPGLDARCKAFVAEAGITGAYHFDLLHDEKTGRTYFLEINGRLGGTTNKVRCCGYEQPLYMLACYDGAPWRDTPPQRRNRRVSNRISIAKRLDELRLQGPNPLDFPVGPRRNLMAKLALGMLGWTDENISVRHWRTTADYFAQMLG